MKKIVALLVLLGLLAAGALLALEFYGPQSIALARNVVLYDRGQLRFSLVKDLSAEFATSLQVGTDGRIYVAQEKGAIFAYEVERGALQSIRSVSEERIDIIAEIPNHEDDGRLNPEVEGRLITGLLAAGAADAPAFYVSSSDPRVYGVDVDTNSGIVSRITKEGDVWRREDLVCGLPRSRTDHANNGLYLDQTNQHLYVIQGGNTNQGGPAERTGYLPEFALSGALLRIDLARLPEGCFNLPTLDDPDRPGAVDENDPYGGADGRNQAVLDPDGPVTLFATGFRNAYRVVPFQGGFLAIDNGTNQGFGGRPKWNGDQVTNEPSEEAGDRLEGPMLRIREGSYHGHPNPTRADRRNTFAGQSPLVESRPAEARFVSPRRREGAVALFQRSVNGMAWYPEDVGPEEWRGKLVVVGWDRLVRLFEFDEAGWISRADVLVEQAASTPLDIAISGTGSDLEGVIWICDYASGAVIALDPVMESAGLLDSLGVGYRRLLTMVRAGVLAYHDRSSQAPTIEVLLPEDAP